VILAEYRSAMPSARRDLLASLGPVAKALRRLEDVAAATEDLTMWQYAVLSVVAERPGLNQGQVARALQYSSNRIVADLDLLEGRHLVTRRPGADRRSNRLHITGQGREVQRRVQERIHAGEDELLAGLTSAQQAQLRSAAERVASRLGDG
jgi:DNA-binding MarR family transcriptional regulator